MLVSSPARRWIACSIAHRVRLPWRAHSQCFVSALALLYERPRISLRAARIVSRAHLHCFANGLALFSQWTRIALFYEWARISLRATLALFSGRARVSLRATRVVFFVALGCFSSTYRAIWTMSLFFELELPRCISAPCIIIIITIV